MDIILKVILPAVVLIGCDVYEPVSTSILLTDTTGKETSTFSKTEHFDIKFSLTNNTDRTMMFTRNSSAPDIRFSIYKGDSLVSSSTDGYAFLMTMSVGSLGPGQSLHGYWRGPTTSAQDPKTSLAPGKYMIEISIPKFNDVQQIQVLPVAFTVTDGSD